MASEDEPVSLATRAIEGLDLDPDVRRALLALQAEVTAAYQKNFVSMVETMKRQASALERLQMTLALLVEKIAPEIKDRVPATLRVASADESPDLASAIVLADPIAAGYTLTQANLAEALGLQQPDVSVLVRAFGINDEEECAVTVRRGKSGQNTTNYHPRAIQRFRELVAHPPSSLTAAQASALKRTIQRLVVVPLKG
jgi:hypothetical protein